MSIYVETHHGRGTRTLRRYHLPPEQLLAECLDVWKTRLVLESGEPISRYDGVNLSLRMLLRFWIEGERNEEGGQRARRLGNNLAFNCWRPEQFDYALSLPQLMFPINFSFFLIGWNDSPIYIEPSTRLRMSSCLCCSGPFRPSTSRSCSRASDDDAVPSR